MPLETLQRLGSAESVRSCASSDLSTQASLQLTQKNNFRDTCHGTQSRASMPYPTPIVFVVDDDISVRESLESLIRCEGWEPETFSSAEEFLNRPRVHTPSC